MSNQEDEVSRTEEVILENDDQEEESQSVIDQPTLTTQESDDSEEPEEHPHESSSSSSGTEGDEELQAQEEEPPGESSNPNSSEEDIVDEEENDESQSETVEEVLNPEDDDEPQSEAVDETEDTLDSLYEDDDKKEGESEEDSSEYSSTEELLGSKPSRVFCPCPIICCLCDSTSVKISNQSYVLKCWWIFRGVFLTYAAFLSIIIVFIFNLANTMTTAGVYRVLDEPISYRPGFAESDDSKFGIWILNTIDRIYHLSMLILLLTFGSNLIYYIFLLLGQIWSRKSKSMFLVLVYRTLLPALLSPFCCTKANQMRHRLVNKNVNLISNDSKKYEVVRWLEEYADCFSSWLCYSQNGVCYTPCICIFIFFIVALATQIDLFSSPAYIVLIYVGTILLMVSCCSIGEILLMLYEIISSFFRILTNVVYVSMGWVFTGKNPCAKFVEVEDLKKKKWRKVDEENIFELSPWADWDNWTLQQYRKKLNMMAIAKGPIQDDEQEKTTDEDEPHEHEKVKRKRKRIRLRSRSGDPWVNWYLCCAMICFSIFVVVGVVICFVLFLLFLVNLGDDDKPWYFIFGTYESPSIPFTVPILGIIFLCFGCCMVFLMFAILQYLDITKRRLEGIHEIDYSTCSCDIFPYIVEVILNHRMEHILWLLFCLVLLVVPVSSTLLLFGRLYTLALIPPILVVLVLFCLYFCRARSDEIISRLDMLAELAQSILSMIRFIFVWLQERVQSRGKKEEEDDEPVELELIEDPSFSSDENEDHVVGEVEVEEYPSQSSRSSDDEEEVVEEENSSNISNSSEENEGGSGVEEEENSSESKEREEEEEEGEVQEDASGDENSSDGMDGEGEEKEQAEHEEEEDASDKKEESPIASSKLEDDNYINGEDGEKKEKKKKDGDEKRTFVRACCRKCLQPGNTLLRWTSVSCCVICVFAWFIVSFFFSIAPQTKSIFTTYNPVALPMIFILICLTGCSGVCQRGIRCRVIFRLSYVAIHILIWTIFLVFSAIHDAKNGIFFPWPISPEHEWTKFKGVPLPDGYFKGMNWKEGKAYPGEHEYEICSGEWSGLDIVDMILMAELPYVNEESEDFLYKYFPQCSSGGNVTCSWTRPDKRSDAIYFHIYNPSEKWHIVTIRGTSVTIDYLQDAALWKETALLQVFDFVLPVLSNFSPRNLRWLMWLWSLTDVFSAGFLTYSKRKEDGGEYPYQFQHPSLYYSDIVDYVIEKVDLLEDEMLYLVGHSLGGGLAQAVALSLNLIDEKKYNSNSTIAFSFAGPGMQITSGKFLGVSDYVEKVDKLELMMERAIVNVKPDGDIVSGIDFLSGAVQHVGCFPDFDNIGPVFVSPLTCHSSIGILASLLRSCGNNRKGRVFQ